MAKKRKRSRSRRSWAGCGCPRGSRRISTRGHGRGWACQSNRPRRFKGRLVKKPFVKAVCR